MAEVLEMSDVCDRTDAYEELRHLRFLIRVFDGVVDSEWKEKRKVLKGFLLKSRSEDDDETDAAVEQEEEERAGDGLGQEQFLSLGGGKPPWWKGLVEGAKEWWKATTREEEVEEKEEVSPEDAPDARVMGLGLWGRLTGRQVDTEGAPYGVRVRHARICQSMDRRPFFTYWVCAVQTAILLLVLAAQSNVRMGGDVSSLLGLAPFGLGGMEQRSGFVLTEFLTLEQVSYWRDNCNCIDIMM